MSPGRAERVPPAPGAAGGQARPRGPAHPAAQPPPSRLRREARARSPDGSNLSSQETLSYFLAILPVLPTTYPARPRGSAAARAPRTRRPRGRNAERLRPRAPRRRGPAAERRGAEGSGGRGLCARTGGGSARFSGLLGQGPTKAWRREWGSPTWTQVVRVPLHLCPVAEGWIDGGGRGGRVFRRQVEPGRGWALAVGVAPKEPRQEGASQFLSPIPRAVWPFLQHLSRSLSRVGVRGWRMELGQAFLPW